MALENATYVSQLVPSNPTSTDSVAQADDHLRLIKQALKNSFPNINGQVTATVAALNSLTGTNTVPSGFIGMWSGSIATIPSGWYLCDGTNGTPNLTDKFIVGAGASYAAGTSGGSATSGLGGGATVTSGSGGAHSHTGSTGGTAITIAQMPSHSHVLSGDSTAEDNNYTPGSTLLAEGSIVRGTYSLTTQTAGSGETHSHTISAEAAHTHSVTLTAHTHSVLPPYYALCFIMKA